MCLSIDIFKFGYTQGIDIRTHGYEQWDKNRQTKTIQIFILKLKIDQDGECNKIIYVHA